MEWFPQTGRMGMWCKQLRIEKNTRELSERKEDYEFGEARGISLRILEALWALDDFSTKKLLPYRYQQRRVIAMNGFNIELLKCPKDTLRTKGFRQTQPFKPINSRKIHIFQSLN